MSVAVAGPAILVNDVSKRFGRTLALDDVSLTVGKGELIGLLGPNGAGKTTLVNILCTVLRPDSGHAEIAGVDLRRHPLDARRRLGIVFQEPSLDERLSVRENLELHGMVFGVPAGVRRRRIAEMMALVNLEAWADKPAAALSSGMKRRLEIARALVHDAGILLLDEPTVGLDVQTRERIWDHIEALRRTRELTVLVTTHYIEEVDRADRVCIIDQGRILANDTPQALKAAHGVSLLRVEPRTAKDARAILAAFATRVVKQDGAELVLASDEGFPEAFLGTWGGRIASMSVMEASLESVFLKLTGRDLRDKGVGAREQTYSFGKRGGEHTR